MTDEEAFATFGPEVPAHEVPAMVRAGRLVWSFGYGAHDPEYDDEGRRLFTVIDRSDLWAWDERTQPEGAAVVADWAPFRVETEV